MVDYDVGYGKPPKKSRFKAGISGNPKGRPKRDPTALAGIISGFLREPMPYRERGRAKTTSRYELSLKMLVDHAAKGSLDAAKFILEVRAHAQRYGEADVDRLLISDWLPDYPGQTAHQKTRETASIGDADPPEWWQTPSSRPTAGS